MESRFSQLPNELLYQILLSTPARDLVRLCQTDVRFRELCNDELLWRTKTINEFNIRQKPNNTSWKYFYLHLALPKVVHRNFDIIGRIDIDLRFDSIVYVPTPARNIIGNPIISIATLPTITAKLNAIQGLQNNSHLIFTDRAFNPIGVGVYDQDYFPNLRGMDAPIRVFTFFPDVNSTYFDENLGFYNDSFIEDIGHIFIIDPNQMTYITEEQTRVLNSGSPSFPNFILPLNIQPSSSDLDFDLSLIANTNISLKDREAIVMTQMPNVSHMEDVLGTGPYYLDFIKFDQTILQLRAIIDALLNGRSTVLYNTGRNI